MMSMSRIVRYAVGLAVVLAFSAQVAQAAAPDHLRWKGQTADRIGPKRAPMAFTPIHRNEVVLGGAVRQPVAVVRVVHADVGGFDWTAALAGAGSAVGIVLLAGGATAGVRSRRRVATS
jgi:hypothetical protein